MKRKRNVYFDHKAGITKIAHCPRNLRNGARRDGPFRLRWDADSRLSWDEFVEKWEGRFSAES